jgi:NitT/TauT family transport system substrate-binding protein
MLDRRRALQCGVAALGSLSVMTSRARAQRKLTKVRYNEVVRSILYTPAYAAMAKGFFEELGLDVTMATAQGGDKSMAALIGDGADIALMGPEAAIYVLTSDSPVKARIFCGLTSTDGFMLVGRTKVDRFDWGMLKGKDILGFRPGSTPLLFFEAAMRQNGIDPLKDVKLANNVGIPARVGSWLVY